MKNKLYSFTIVAFAIFSCTSKPVPMSKEEMLAKFHAAVMQEIQQVKLEKDQTVEYKAIDYREVISGTDSTYNVDFVVIVNDRGKLDSDTLRNMPFTKDFKVIKR